MFAMFLLRRKQRANAKHLEWVHQQRKALDRTESEIMRLAGVLATEELNLLITSRRPV